MYNLKVKCNNLVNWSFLNIETELNFFRVYENSFWKVLSWLDGKEVLKVDFIN